MERSIASDENVPQKNVVPEFLWLPCLIVSTVENVASPMSTTILRKVNKMEDNEA